MILTTLGVPPDQITCCLSGKEALDIVKKSISDKQTEIGIIFTDLSMPIMDGYRLAYKVRKECR